MQDPADTLFFLGRQPILDRKGQVAAYELLFRSAATGGAAGAGEVEASATVITRAFGALGIEAVLADRLGFINVGPALLMGDLIELLPPQRVVLELIDTVHADEPVIARCQELKARGFRLSLDDYVLDDPRCEGLGALADYVKVDIEALPPSVLPQLVQRLRRRAPLVVAEKVETREQAELCRKAGFDLFQGYFFARPVVLTGRRFDAERTTLLRLLSLTLQDAPPQQIEAVFRHSPQLTYNLLRLVNSVAVGPSQRIGNIGHAITVLGMRQLQRWLQLLLFTVDGDGQGFASPLLLLAASRARLIELLAEQHQPAERTFHEQAFLVGILSLVDVALEMPLVDVVGALHLAEPVERAILDRSGSLGSLLAVAEELEQLRFGEVAHLLAGLPGVDMSVLPLAQVQATRWAQGLADERT